MAVNRSHNATVAKIRAMYGNRLKQADYDELVNKSSVAEIAEYLKKNTHYGKMLSSIDTVNIHRGFLEDLLKRYNFEMYLRIIDFEKLGNIEFYNFRIISGEINIIIDCLRHINAKSAGQIENLPIYINKYTCFDLIEIAKVRSFDELLVFLKRTPYYDVLKNTAADSSGRVDLSACEMKLRNYYIGRLEKTVSGYKKSEADKIYSMIFTEIDLINLINAYRMTAFFGADDNEIEKNMLHFYGRLSEKKQREIYSATDKDEYVRRFAKTIYGRQISDSGHDLNDLEQNANLLRFKYAKMALKSSQTAPVSVYSFTYLMTVELQNLISIIEGVRYGVAPKQIQSLITV